jgi:hypothetical protein
MIRYNKSVIDWFLEQQLFCLTLRLRATVQSSGQTKQLLSSDPVNNCILLIEVKKKTRELFKSTNCFSLNGPRRTNSNKLLVIIA